MSLEGRRLRRRPWSLDIFPSRFRRSDGRGRPSHSVARASTPASRIEVGSIFSRNDIVDGSTHTGIPEGANRRLHARFPEGCSENRPPLQRRFLRIRQITTCKYVLYDYYAFTPALRDGIVFCIGIPALKRRPIFKAPLRGALQFGQFPSRFQQSDGRGRPSRNVQTQASVASNTQRA